MPILSRNMRRCLGMRVSAKRLCILFRMCRNRSWSQKSRDPSEEKSKTGAKQAEKSAQRCSCVARTLDFSAEGRRGARTFYGRGGRLSRGQTWRLRRRIAAYGMATAGTCADRAMGHPGIQPEREARFTWISRRLLAEDARAAR